MMLEVVESRASVVELKIEEVDVVVVEMRTKQDECDVRMNVLNEGLE